PAGEVGIAPVRKDQVAADSFNSCVVAGFPLQVNLGASDIVLRAVLHPRMINAGMIRNKIQHQPQSAFSKPLAQTEEGSVTSQLLMSPITRDCETRTGDVLFFEVTQGFLKFPAPLRIGA